MMFIRKNVSVSKERRSVVKKVLTASEVIDAIVNAESPANKAHATRKLNAYVAQRVKDGFEEYRVRAAITAHVTRRLQPV